MRFFFYQLLEHHYPKCCVAQINTLPPEVVKYFTDPNATEPPDMQLLYPFVDSALPLAYGVLGVQLFHVTKVSHMRLSIISFRKKIINFITF